MDPKELSDLLTESMDFLYDPQVAGNVSRIYLNYGTEVAKSFVDVVRLAYESNATNVMQELSSDRVMEGQRVRVYNEVSKNYDLIEKFKNEKFFFGRCLNFIETTDKDIGKVLSPIKLKSNVNQYLKIARSTYEDQYLKMNEMLEKYGEDMKIPILNALSRNAGSFNASVMYKMIEFFDREIDITAVGRMYVTKNLTNSSNVAKQWIDIVEMYSDNKAWWNYYDKNYASLQGRLGIIDTEELLRLRAYNAIKNGSDVAKIVNGESKKGIDKIRDEEVRDNASYSDLKLVENTWNFVKQIHTGRKTSQRKEIERAFKCELERAMSQGCDLKSKIKNLRQFCYDVKKQMKDNASDLMVVTNE